LIEKQKSAAKMQHVVFVFPTAIERVEIGPWYHSKPRFLVNLAILPLYCYLVPVNCKETFFIGQKQTILTS